jgi:hypothetical protein
MNGIQVRVIDFEGQRNRECKFVHRAATLNLPEMTSSSYKIENHIYCDNPLVRSSLYMADRFPIELYRTEPTHIV